MSKAKKSALAKNERVQQRVSARIQIERHAQDVQLTLLEENVSYDQLDAVSRWMQPPNFDEVVEERAALNMCGLPTCTNSINFQHNQSIVYFDETTERNSVYQVMRPFFCSKTCLVSALYFRGQLSTEPIYMRSEKYPMAKCRRPDSEVGETGEGSAAAAAAESSFHAGLRLFEVSVASVKEQLPPVPLEALNALSIKETVISSPTKKRVSFHPDVDKQQQQQQQERPAEKPVSIFRKQLEQASSTAVISAPAPPTTATLKRPAVALRRAGAAAAVTPSLQTNEKVVIRDVVQPPPPPQQQQQEIVILEVAPPKTNPRPKAPTMPPAVPQPPSVVEQAELESENDSGEEDEVGDDDDSGDEFTVDARTDEPLSSQDKRSIYLQLSLFARTWGFFSRAVTPESINVVHGIPNVTTSVPRLVGDDGSDFVIHNPEKHDRQRVFMELVMKGLGTLRQPLGMDHSVDHLFMELVDTFELANDVGNLQASEVQVICIIALRVLVPQSPLLQRILAEKGHVISQILDTLRITPDHVHQYLRLFQLTPRK